MIPRGALVAGGFAVVAGGAVYLIGTDSPEPTDAPDVDPRTAWIVDSRDHVGRSSDASLAIPDPLQHAGEGRASGAVSGLLASSAQQNTIPFNASRSSLRPLFVPDPALPSRFAAPASAQFASGVRSAVPLAPLSDPARGAPLAAQAAPQTLQFAPPSISDEESRSSRPVAIGRHLIQDGDTLEAIALANYGDRSLAPFLYEQNRRILKYPDLLPVGREIVLYAPPAARPAGPTLGGPAPGGVAPAQSAIVAAPLFPSTSLPGIAPPELAPLE